MKLTLLLLIFITNISFASLPTGVIKDLNVNYTTPKGTATADYLNIQELGEYNSPTLEVENNNGLLAFLFDDKEFEIDLSLFAVKDADYITIDNMNFTNNDEAIDLDFYKLTASSVGYSTNIKYGKSTCERKTIFDDASDDLIFNCLSKSEFSIDEFVFISQDEEFKSIFDQKVSSSKISIWNFEVNVDDGDIVGSFSSNLSLGVTIDFKGSIDYQKEKEMIIVEVKEIYAGFISIRGKVLSELKKNAPDNVTVEEPYIYIDLK